MCGAHFCAGAERTIKVQNKYLNIPISHERERNNLTFSAPGMDELKVQVRISPEGEDYWVFKDISAYKGKALTLTYDGSQQALDRLFQADTICGSSAMYKEKLRPQYHFSSRRGWLNDPNGLVWHDGEYHLYYQHNPYERLWGNMHWGHAVSSDLLHWEEYDDVLFPDKMGGMFSGSAVYDPDNTSGFGNKKTSPLVYAYTSAAGKMQKQCIAYSLDKGRTLVKYRNNPVIDSWDAWQTKETRDPKLLWYAPGKHWVMVLYEKDGQSFYTSDNLKDWTYRSHIRGFYECPDLFELPVDGNRNNKKWVLMGASGTYMIGDFDGMTFTPQGGKYRYTAGRGYAYQTVSGMPDSRVVQIAWGRVDMPGMPFNNEMLLPTELSLKTTVDGIRLCSFPVGELNSIMTRCFTSVRPMNAREASRAMKEFEKADCLHIRTTIQLSHSTFAGIDLDGQKIVNFDSNQNLLNNFFFFLQDPRSLSLSVDIYIDRASVEVFADGGLFSYSMLRRPEGNQLGFRFWGREDITVTELIVDRVDSIYNSRDNAK